MKQYAMTVALKDDPQFIQKYRSYHGSVWPEVEQGLKLVGVLTMDIFISGRLLFMLMETIDSFDLESDFKRFMTTHPRCLEWEREMDACMEDSFGAGTGEKWALMERVFQLS